MIKIISFDARYSMQLSCLLGHLKHLQVCQSACDLSKSKDAS